jgi:D-3-phosphoglycerate dehydrogenase / 2-oxoglutarate reductase
MPAKKKDKFKVVSMGKIAGMSMDKERKVFAKNKLDVEAVEARCSTEDELIAVARDADAILGGGRLLSRRVMEALPACRAIVTYSVGFDGIDVEAATDCGILVVNNPAREWCGEEVANHAMTLLLACAKKLTILNDMVKAGKWGDTRKLMPPMASIHGQTLGIIGCGDIGRRMATKAEVFGMNVLGYDPYADESAAVDCGVRLTSMRDLLKKSDFVSVHTPLDKGTFHLMGEKEFKLMKPTAYFINTSRGSVVDEPALIKALQSKQIAGAGLDVFEKEPVDPKNPLLKMDNVIVMPHSASYSDAALDVQPVNPAEEVSRVLKGNWPKNPVNPKAKPKVKLAKAK